MADEQRILELIQESFDSLFRSGLLPQQLKVDSNTVLLGDGSPLESIAFVTFVADLEMRLDRELGETVYLILSDIHEFNPSKSSLTAGTLARYVAATAARGSHAG